MITARRSSVVLFLCVIALVMGSLTVPASAGDPFPIVVTTNIDELNSDEDCSLREAIQAANTNSDVDECDASGGADAIEVPAGTYELTIPNSDENNNATGDLDITDDVTMTATGGRAIIDGGARPNNPKGQFDCFDVFFSGKGFADTGNGDRILHVIDSNLDMDGFDIMGGFTDNVSDNTNLAQGAGMWVDFSASATLTDTRVHDNFALVLNDSFNDTALGAGILNDGVLQLFDDSRVTRNAAVTDGAASGGGIFSRSQQVRATEGTDPQGVQFPTRIEDSRVNSNLLCTPFSDGAGLNTQQRTFISNSTFSNNLMESQSGTSTGRGGGIFLEGFGGGGDVEIADSTISNNSVASPGESDGGGIINFSELTMSRTTVSGNTIMRGNNFTSQGAGLHSGSTIEVTRSTFDNNTVIEAPSKRVSGPQSLAPTTEGGGMYFQHTGQEDAFVTNVTVANNEADVGAGVYAGVGNNGDVFLKHVTIARNDGRPGTKTGGEGFRTTADGGEVHVQATIVAQNTPKDCQIEQFSFFSGNWNLASDGSCNFDGPNDLNGTNPGLNDLANNGGPTRTMRLNRNSPAVDHVGPSAPKTNNGCPPPSIDQRGQPRPRNGDGSGNARCDIGAFELGPPSEPPPPPPPPDKFCRGFKDDPRNQVVGTTGDDVLKGTSGPDVICGRSGDDVLMGFEGNDLLLSGADDDRSLGGPGNDTIRGQRGEDRVVGSKGNDELHGGAAQDSVLGTAGNDSMQGHTGADTLNGGGGNDFIKGEEQDDLLIGGSGNDNLHGGKHNDNLQGDAGDDTLRGSLGDDGLDGGPDTDDCDVGQGGAQSETNCEV